VSGKRKQRVGDKRRGIQVGEAHVLQCIRMYKLLMCNESNRVRTLH
jgi:hypothetical protein